MKPGPARAAAVRIALLAAALYLPVAPAAAQRPESALPVLGVDPLVRGTVLERHADALPHWLLGGHRGAVLLHFDTHDDLHELEPGKLAALMALGGRGDADALARAGAGGADALFGETDFVRAAAVLGIVREVVWVVPFPFPEEGDGAAGVRAFLGRAGFGPADIETFRRAGRCWRGAAGALPVSVCAQEALPPVDEPVLLSIDAGYLLAAASYRDVSPLTQVKGLAAALRDARYVARDAVVAHSVQDGRVPVGMRWVAEAMVEVLRTPSIALQQDPPERMAALQRLSALRAAGRTDEMLEVSHSLLERQPHDPALLLFAAEAMAGHGSSDSALAYATGACRAERGYCAGLREIGLQVLERGAVEAALPILAEAERVLPGAAVGRLDEGILLARGGRPVEAVKALEALIAIEGAFPAAFVAGGVHASTGDRAAARRSYDAAAAALGGPHVSVAREDVAAAIRAAAVFYRTEGLAAAAERLEGDARLRLPPEGGRP